VPPGALGVAPAPVPGRLRFAAPFPNPARGAVSLSLDVPATGELTVDVLDAQGRRIATLERRDAVPAGRRAIAWSGRTGTGRRAAPGAYFVRARVSGLQASVRVVLR
jgi:flagellar hook assembly protein FlgD